MSEKTDALRAAKPLEALGDGSVIQHYTFHPVSVAAEAVTCTYKSETYSPGSRLCQEKVVMLCGADGSWQETSPKEAC